MTSNHLPTRHSNGWHWMTTAVLAMMTLSCDSRWYDMQRSQRSAVERTRPAELRSSMDETRASNQQVREAEVRVYVSPRYSTELMGWREQLDTMIDDANRLLEPSLHVRLVIQDIRTWKPAEGEPTLDKALGELRGLDAAPDRVWVMGLVGSVPRAATSIHELGMANLMGKHMVLRTMNDAREYDAIQQHLRGGSEQERRAIYRQRKRHKTTAVLLHEFAHTLGVPHELAQKALMNPTYDIRVEGFSHEVLGAMRIALDHRFGGNSSSNGALAQELARYVEQTTSTWVPADRDDLLGRLRSMGTAGQPPSRPALIAELAEADNAVFADARSDLQAKRRSDAWKKAQPLFSRYPNVYQVQELRCQIAMEIGGEWSNVEKECALLLQFTNETIEGNAQK